MGGQSLHTSAAVYICVRLRRNGRVCAVPVSFVTLCASVSLCACSGCESPPSSYSSYFHCHPFGHVFHTFKFLASEIMCRHGCAEDQCRVCARCALNCAVLCSSVLPVCARLSWPRSHTRPLTWKTIVAWDAHYCRRAVQTAAHFTGAGAHLRRTRSVPLSPRAPAS